MRDLGQANLQGRGMLTCSHAHAVWLFDRMRYPKRTTVHGVCCQLLDLGWANDSGIARPDVIEACLAHREADKLQAAYN